MLNAQRLTEICRLRPLIHCLSNVVSANDCANLVLAAGASPIMAQAPEEMADIAAQAQVVVLNTGTPDREKFQVCRLCGREALSLGKPVVLDPVGVGSSPWRLRETETLLRSVSPSLFRVNFAKARALLRLEGRELGVDSPGPASLEERLEAALLLSRQSHAAVLLSGPEDIAAGGGSAWRISGGSPRTARITGSGCMLSALCGVFSAVEPDMVQAALLAAVFWKLCAQRAEEWSQGRGPGAFRAALLDAAEAVTAGDLAAGERLVSPLTAERRI